MLNTPPTHSNYAIIAELLSCNCCCLSFSLDQIAEVINLLS